MDSLKSTDNETAEGESVNNNDINDEPDLYPKYAVIRIDDDFPERELKELGIEFTIATNPKKVDSPFVLMPRKDPAAFMALITYMKNCDFELSCSLRKWLQEISEAGFDLGTQGGRNYVSIMSNMLREG